MYVLFDHESTRPLITARRPDQVIDYTICDSDVYIQIYRPDAEAAHGPYSATAKLTYHESCLQFDLFNSIGKVDPKFTQYGLAINRRLCRIFRNSDEYETVREQCNFDPFACYIAAQEIMRKLMESLNEQTKNASKHAEEMLAIAEQAEGLADACENDPDQSLADQEKARRLAVLHRANYDAAIESLDKALKFMPQSDAIDAAIAAAVAGIEHLVRGALCLSSIAGKQKQDLRLEGIDAETLKIANRLRANSQFNRIVDLVGRVRNDLYNALVGKSRANAGAVVEVETGSDIPLVLPEELASLVDPDLAAFAQYNLVCENLDQLSVEETSHAAQGDAIVLVDASGSMSGTPIESAKAFALALSSTLARARRSSHVAFFNYGVMENSAKTFRPADFCGKASTVAAIEHLLGVCASGGTDINAALDYAGSKAESLKLSKPDIVVISDGYDSMSNETRDEFNKFRLRSGGRLFAIFTGVSRQTAESSPLAKLADKFWCEDDILKSLIEVGESVS